MSEQQQDAWHKLTIAAYEQVIENMLKPNPLTEMFARTHDEWWAKQTRWFKIRYRVRNWYSDKWYESRRSVADLIFPEGRDW